MHVVIHFGLAALLVIAPALCCCNVRLLAGLLTNSSTPDSPCPVCPQPEPVLPSCCHSAKPVAKKSCCQASESAKNNAQQQPKPATPKPERCDFCFGEKPNATPPKGAPSVASPEPTGELIPVSLLGFTALPIEQLGLVGGLDPPERAGVDTRFESLFTRHVLRC